MGRTKPKQVVKLISPNSRSSEQTVGAISRVQGFIQTVSQKKPQGRYIKALHSLGNELFAICESLVPSQDLCTCYVTLFVAYVVAEGVQR